MDFLSIWDFIFVNVLTPIGNAFQALLYNVLIPFWDAFTEWVKTCIPWTEKFANFCMSIFKFKYMGRIYSLMLTIPIAILFILFGRIPGMIRSWKKRKKRKDQYKIYNIK